MSNSLDKSLDDIISSGKKGKKVGRKSQQQKKAAGKLRSATSTPGGKAVAAKKQKAQTQRATAQVLSNQLDASMATKVIVDGLPKDLKSNMIKEFFQSQVGGVSNVSMTYNERGQFKGNATINFKSSASAALAVQKYNNAPIDGGSSKLKLELVIDPSKKPLALRISANKVSQPQAEGQTKAQKLRALRQRAIKPNAAAVTQKPKKNKPKKEKREQKTAEQLDQDMDAYMSQA